MRVSVVDIETGAAEELHSFGPGYFRIGARQDLDTATGVTGKTEVTSDPYEFAGWLDESESLTWHNGILFDALVMAKYYSEGIEDRYERWCRKSFDTLIVERHLNPIAAKGAQPRGYYGLDATAERYGVAGKSTVGFEGRLEIVRRVKGDVAAGKLLKAYELRKRKAGAAFTEPVNTSALKLLASLYGGYHLIPQDDPDYVHYLRMDIGAQAGLFLAQTQALAGADAEDRRYIRREHSVNAVMGRITLEGFRTDQDLTMSRWSAGHARIEASKQSMHERYGMPLGGAKPHVTNLGKAAFRQAILDTGISETALAANWPVNKDGSLATGKDVLNAQIQVFEQSVPEAAELCRTILAMNGERSVWGTILENVVEGRVHAAHKTQQSSGRVSVTDPGLTVLKKPERDVLLPDNDDEWLVAVDGSQIDARMVAALSGDEQYRKLFAPGLDMHSGIAWRVWSSTSDHGPDCVTVPAPLCKCGRRKLAKVAGHSWNYGAAAKSLSVNLGLPFEEATRFDQGMTGSFPRLVAWKGEVREAAGVMPFGETAPADDSHRVLTNPFGRTVRVERSRAYTQSIGLLCQSATRDSMMHAIMKLPVPVRRKIRAFVHDEIVVSVEKSRAVEISHEIADMMAFDLRGVPITFSGGDYGPNWAACYLD